jgi:Uma2 family endonuclease
VATQPTPFLTPEQYLEIERAAETRSEYIGGQMYAISGGTLNHARIAANALSRLNEQLRGEPCEAVGSDLRLYSEQFGFYTYPDIVITCGQVKLQDRHNDTIMDATAIVEILSPSTKNYDRGEKFRFYRALPSFSEYVVLSQDAIRAEHHVRQPDGSWLFREFNSPESELELNSIGCRLNLGSLYERVVFES